MTNIVKMIAGAVLMLGPALGGPALASSDSPFYPDNFKNPNPPHALVGAGSGIPSQYRLGR
jgi:hypothetical protein